MQQPVRVADHTPRIIHEFAEFGAADNVRDILIIPAQRHQRRINGTRRSAGHTFDIGQNICCCKTRSAPA